MIEIDLLLKNVRELINPADKTVVRGHDLNSIRISKDVWIGGAGDKIVFYR